MECTATNDIAALPLAGLRILEMADGKGDMCGRYLADMGADVILLEPPQGLASRRSQPLHNGQSLFFASHNANKRSLVLDLHTANGKAQFLDLLDTVDALIETNRPGTLESLGLAVADLRRNRPGLVVLSLTDFGQSGPYRDYQASNAVLMALGGVLSRSGIEGKRPLLPPGDMAFETTAIQAAWGLLLAFWQRLHTGLGDHLDFSRFEATAQILDPGLGVTGSAAGGKSAAELVPRGRPPISILYPIFPCVDCHVRVCILNPRQWQGMSTWLGDSHPFTDPAFGNLARRYSVIGEVNALIAHHFHDKRGEELVAEGQQRGIPIAVVASPRDVLADHHFAATQAFTSIGLTDGSAGALANGYCRIDGSRMGIRTQAPGPGEHTAQILRQRRGRQSSPAPAAATPRRPFAGLRVLDLGVIVAGAELGRLFADQGAEVIKIENHVFPDGLRQSSGGHKMTTSFAQGSRGKLSFGLNLRCDEGIALFKQLVGKSDLVLSNFKPGTMESLGLGYEVLKEINPRIILADSSALGSTGPRSKSMGYGPLVRASAGLTGLWRYPEIEEGFCDGVTIYPDHFAARVAAVAIAALLVRREQTGIGGTVSVSQAECILNVMATQFLRESVEPDTMVQLGDHNEFDAPNTVFPCAGDDEWCVVSVRDDHEWQRLCEAIGRHDWMNYGSYATARGRIAHRRELEAGVAEWTKRHSPQQVMEILQAAGVPAGAMLRLDDLAENPHLQARRFFRTLEQPGMPRPLLTENGPVGHSALPDPAIRPAPLQAEHTRELAGRVLDLSAKQIEQFIEAGVLEVMPSETKEKQA